MARFLILSFALCTAPTAGTWVLKNGEVVEKPCPTVLDMVDKARLPQGCVAHQAGVWQSRKSYTDKELELVRLQQEVKAGKAREALLTKQIDVLEAKLRLTTIAPACDCKNKIFNSIAITTGACAVWTLYQLR